MKYVRQGMYRDADRVGMPNTPVVFVVVKPEVSSFKIGRASTSDLKK
jgi:hypothetical protein